MEITRTGVDQFRDLVSHRSNQFKLLRVFLGSLFLGVFLDATGMSGLLKYILPLGFLNLGIYLNDVATAVRFGNIELPSYPAFNDIWGVAGRALLMGFPAAGLWVSPLLLAPLTAHITSFVLGILIATITRYAYGQERAPFAEWGVSIFVIGLFCLGASAVIRTSFETASYFAPLSVSTAVIVVIAASFAANGLRD